MAGLTFRFPFSLRGLGAILAAAVAFGVTCTGPQAGRTATAQETKAMAGEAIAKG